ncbi:MAG: hypothetical protein UIB31_04930, partial [Methanobrevibacter sp.]|nr:hypothetical protein [Methanobrevibacter sp.]
DIILTDNTADTTSSKPESLFFIFMNIFLKNVMIEPIITTGCTLVGSSPKRTSIASENSNDIAIK